MKCKGCGRTIGQSLDGQELCESCYEDAVIGAYQQPEAMDSLEFSKKYDVFSISRLSLSSLGFSFDQVKSLTDDDMSAIADSVREEIEQLIGNGMFDEDVRFATDVCLAEKRERGGAP